MSSYILVMTTVPDEKVGQKIAQQVVKDRLAACVTISEASQSLYWWQGEISKEKERILLIKTKAALYHELEEKIVNLHPYEVPEIIAIPILKGYTKYLDWIESETNKKK